MAYTNRDSIAREPSTWRVVAGVGAFIVLFAIHLALTSHANTVTWDEPDTSIPDTCRGRATSG